MTDETTVEVPRALLEEVASWHPGCVMPESYSASMYGLAQAICAVLDHTGVKEPSE